MELLHLIHHQHQEPQILKFKELEPMDLQPMELVSLDQEQEPQQVQLGIILEIYQDQDHLEQAEQLDQAELDQDLLDLVQDLVLLDQELVQQDQVHTAQPLMVKDYQDQEPEIDLID
jgi:hypothetical protein